MVLDDLHSLHHATDHGLEIAPHTPYAIAVLLAIALVLFAFVFWQVMAKEKEEAEQRKNR